MTDNETFHVRSYQSYQLGWERSFIGLIEKILKIIIYEQNIS
jgi:hypothetical protein